MIGIERERERRRKTGRKEGRVEEGERAESEGLDLITD